METEIKTKELLTIEFRYHDKPKGEWDSDGQTRKITIGIYDSFDDACLNGNILLEKLESKFEIHTYPNGSKANKCRFSKNGGCFGGKRDLISNLAYLKTPFDFYAKITQLKYYDVEETIVEVLEAGKRYRAYKTENQES